MYKIEAAVRNGLNNPFCSSKANHWLPNHTDVQPMKVNHMNFGHKDFHQQGKKKDHLRRHQSKNIIPLVNKGI